MGGHFNSPAYTTGKVNLGVSACDVHKGGTSMQNINLHHPSSGEHTSVSNIFIDCYMPKASGTYVKLYLCLLRQASERDSVSLEAIADLFDCTENDVRRGLCYWAEQGLLKLTTDASGNITDLIFLRPQRPHNQMYAAATVTPAVNRQTGAAAAPSTQEQQASPSAIPSKKDLTADRISSLQSNQDVQQILYIAEHYLGKPLSSTEINSLLYYYDSLHFDVDLIEYLIEYCISRGITSFHYMDKVALGWAEADVRNVRDAKNNTSLYSRKYYSILNAFGIKGRGPAKSEAALIDRWFDEFHFTSDIILEACSRTIAQTQRPNFQYADKILENWHKNGIHHLSDIQALDAAHKQKTNAAAANRITKSAGSNNKFNNFPQRDYDFEQLEAQLLNQ